MRFMVMHKVDAKMEAGAPPNSEIVQGMGALVKQSVGEGTFITGAGLHRSARRVRVEMRAGESVVTPGPYSGDNELLASFAMIKARSLDEAIERARQFARVLGDIEIEVGPVVEPWDLGLAPEPVADVPGRYLLLCKGDARTERGTEPSPERRAQLEELLDALKKEGVLILADRLAPSSRGARLAAGEKGRRTWVDGPFTESKELIAGFSIIERPSRADAMAWAERYAGILEGNEVDVRELAA